MTDTLLNLCGAFRNKLAYKMLPKVVVKMMMKTGGKVAERFECVTIFFSNVVDFQTMREACSPLDVSCNVGLTLTHINTTDAYVLMMRTYFLRLSAF